MNFSASGRYTTGGARGRFKTDGRSITYYHRVFFDEAEAGPEDRSQYDQPVSYPIEAVDADTLREGSDLYARCPAR